MPISVYVQVVFMLDLSLFSGKRSNIESMLKFAFAEIYISYCSMLHIPLSKEFMSSDGNGCGRASHLLF